jgi:FtsH-binding integral membrane protein
MLSGIFFVYPVGSIGTAFLITAGSFGALSIYGTVTKRDLSAWRTFLFMGLVGVVIASVVQFWWNPPGLTFVLSCAAVVVFAGLTAYDTQKLRVLGAQYAGAGLTSFTIVGALNLYLDFINLFLALLRLFGDRRR